MKNLIAIPFIILALVGCNTTPKNAHDIDLNDFKQRLSYALGADMGANFNNMPDEIFNTMNKEKLSLGFYELLTSTTIKTDDCLLILENALSNPEGINTSQYSMDEISHCYGTIFGDMLRKSLVSKDAMKMINPDIARIGFSDAMNRADTIIGIEERNKMIVDFNNDLNKEVGEKFMKKMSKKHPKDMQEEGYILVENKAGSGEPIDLSLEYNIVYTITNLAGDTIISTIQDPTLPETQNAQTVKGGDIVFPEAWKLAAKNMVVNGDYTIYTDYEYAFGEEGLHAPGSSNYIIQPYSAIIIYSKVLSQDEEGAKKKAKGMEVIAEAKKQPNTRVDESGYILTTLKEGKGPKVKKGADVKAHYILSDSDGNIIQDSHENVVGGVVEAPSFSLENVVKGWQLAIPEMREGGTYKLVLPYDLAYGEKGNSGISPFETLTFEIEVIESGAPGTLVQSNPQQSLTEEQIRMLQEQLQMESNQ